MEKDYLDIIKGNCDLKKFGKHWFRYMNKEWGMFKIHKSSFPKCFIPMIVEYFFNCMVYAIFI